MFTFVMNIYGRKYITTNRRSVEGNVTTFHTVLFMYRSELYLQIFLHGFQ